MSTGNKKPIKMIAPLIPERRTLMTREGEIELSLLAKYSCVYTRDRNGNYSFIYGCRNFIEGKRRDFLRESGIHQLAREQAFSGKSVSYDWFDDLDIPTLYRTMLIPMDSANGIARILCIVKALDSVLVPNKNNSMIVAEKTGQSFIRIIVRAKEEEKRIIATKIHDQLGNASVQLNSLIALLKDDILNKDLKSAKQDISHLEIAMKEAIQNLKKVIVNLRPPQLEAVGLDSALKDLIDNLSETTKVKFRYVFNVNERTVLSTTAKVHLYRIIQEGISNALKHAKATLVKVEVSEKESDLVIKVQDNGIGFVVSKYRSASHIGLAGMKESVSNLHGKLIVNSQIGKGTEIIVYCPKFQN